MGKTSKKAIQAMVEAKNRIRIKGAREHNLKNVDLEIPRDEFIVFTGLSGSGKHSVGASSGVPEKRTDGSDRT